MNDLDRRLGQNEIQTRQLQAVIYWATFAGGVLLHTCISLFGTAMVEPVLGQRLLHPHTIGMFLIKEYLYSAVVAGLLGYLVYARWKPESARWVWLLPACWFAFGAFVTAGSVQGGLWPHFSGMGCEDGVGTVGCRNWFIFTLPAVRGLFYSAGAFFCSCVGRLHPSTIDDAVLARFPVPEWKPEKDRID